MLSPLSGCFQLWGFSLYKPTHLHPIGSLFPASTGLTNKCILQEFREIAHLKKLKVKKQDRIFPPEPSAPAVAAAAPPVSTAPAPVNSVPQGRAGVDVAPILKRGGCFSSSALLIPYPQLGECADRAPEKVLRQPAQTTLPDLSPKLISLSCPIQLPKPLVTVVVSLPWGGLLQSAQGKNLFSSS